MASHLGPVRINCTPWIANVTAAHISTETKGNPTWNFKHSWKKEVDTGAWWSKKTAAWSVIAMDENE